MMETIQMLGSLGEFVGAIAVVATLIYISIQVRHSSLLLEANKRATEENTRLARAAALDRHADVVSRWRGRLIENVEVARIWQRALDDDDLDEIERLRLQNLYIDWINTYRANFGRAKAVGDEGLARQAVLSVAPLIFGSSVLRDLWTVSHPMTELAAGDFVAAINTEIEAQQSGKRPAPGSFIARPGSP